MSADQAELQKTIKTLKNEKKRLQKQLDAASEIMPSSDAIEEYVQDDCINDRLLTFMEDTEEQLESPENPYLKSSESKSCVVF